MPSQVSDWRRHQGAEDGEQHEALVNRRSLPGEIRGNKQRCKHRDVEQWKRNRGEWSRTDDEIAA